MHEKELRMNAKHVCEVLVSNGFEKSLHHGGTMVLKHPDGRRVCIPDHGIKDLSQRIICVIERNTGISLSWK